ncbi:hypothetical protein D3C73_685250 [compost metagenome]
MLCTFTHGIDAGNICFHVIINDDAPVRLDSAFLRQLDIGFDADSHNDQICFSNFSVCEQQAFDSFFAENRFRLLIQQKLHSLLFQLLAEHHGCRFIQLALHDIRMDVYNRDLHSQMQQPSGRLQTQKPAADHHGFAVAL